MGWALYLFSKPVYYAYMARTKQHFGVLVTTITQWWSPTVVRVTGDKSVRHQLKRMPDGRLECEFPERIILIANHQVPSLHALAMTRDTGADTQSDLNILALFGLAISLVDILHGPSPWLHLHNSEGVAEVHTCHWGRHAILWIHFPGAEMGAG